jgi:two-component system, sensor histidine kinase and response regulator
MTRILVVDDDVASARLVAKYLHHDGYKAVIVHDGPAALARATAEPPDLILLDVMMPGMDGLAVCRRLRAEGPTADVPVIFLSARGDLTDRVAGLDVGAVDYLVKPFEPADLLARVRAALRTKALQDSLRRANAELARLERSRQEFVAMLTHDIRGMLGAVAGAIEMVRLDLEDRPSADADRFLEIADRNARELIDLTTNLLDTYRIEEGRLTPRHEAVDLGLAATEVARRLAGQAARKEIALDVVVATGAYALGDDDLLRRVLLNLVSNALKFTPAGGRVDVRVDGAHGSDHEQPAVVVTVRDTGPGIAPDAQAHLFDRFSSLATAAVSRSAGSGLGLSFCKQVVELLGGFIWVESAPGRGSTFGFSLPVAGVAQAPRELHRAS